MKSPYLTLFYDVKFKRVGTFYKIIQLLVTRQEMVSRATNLTS